MSDWMRATRDCSFEGLPAQMAPAIQEHIELNNLGLALSDVLACVETMSRRVKKGLFGDDKSVITAVLLTPGWLLWAIRADNPEVTVMSARLADITVQDYAGSSYARLVPDFGIEVTGSFSGAAERGSAFIGLDEGPAARQFKQQVMDAVQAAKT